MSETYEDQKIDYTAFLSDKPMEQDAAKREAMRYGALRAMSAREVKAKTIRMRCYADGCVMVHTDGEFYGVFDANNGKFFSGCENAEG